MNFHFHCSQIDLKMTSNRHKFFNLVRNEGYVKKISRGGWSGFGKALTWDPSQMITCHPKQIPKFLLKGGVVQFCRRSDGFGIVHVF